MIVPGGVSFFELANVIGSTYVPTPPASLWILGYAMSPPGGQLSYKMWDQFPTSHHSTESEYTPHLSSVECRIRCDVYTDCARSPECDKKSRDYLHCNTQSTEQTIHGRLPRLEKVNTALAMFKIRKRVGDGSGEISSFPSNAGDADAHLVEVELLN